MTPTRKLIFKAVIPFLRRFDRRAAQRVDKFIANSQFIADRIERCYGKPASVIYPPVSVDSFEANTQRKDFFLVVSELVPYKRIDLAVEAFNRLGLPLVVIGDGSERESLEGSAKSNIRFLGRQPFETLKLHYESCKAFVFPGVEDFGITPVEAQAAGAPVIAFDKGGAKETVRDRQTGLLFKEQSVDSLADAISSFEAMTSSGTGFSVSMLAENAERFSETCFQRAFRAELAQIQS